MEIITKSELRLQYPEILQRIKDGAVFIHPSDTIYGLSCNALSSQAVQKLRRLKDRATNPFSVWVPSIDWISKNCKMSGKSAVWLKELPGPYTIVTQLHNKKAVATEVIPAVKTLGVRLPNHWFHKIVQDLDFPIVTTSVNKSGQPFMTSLEDLDADIQAGVDFIVYEGKKPGKPSKIINVVENRVVRE